MSRLISAIHFAAQKHQHQRRKDKEKSPYINHPIHVMHLLAEAGVTDEDTLIAGVLHDTIEDTNTTSDEIKKLFGENVLKIVLECSDDKSLDKVQRKRLQVQHAADISFAAKLVKLADKYSNLCDLLNNPPPTWSKDEIFGYGVWCFVICNKLKGVNEHSDKQFKELFDKFKISEIKDEDIPKLLEKYYKNIKSSE